VVTLLNQIELAKCVRLLKLARFVCMQYVCVCVCGRVFFNNAHIYV